MNRFLKMVGAIVAGLSVLMVIAVLCAYFYVSTSWKKYYTEEQVKEFAKEIDSAPAFTENFYAIYDKLHGNQRHRSILGAYAPVIAKVMVSMEPNGGPCWYVNAARIYMPWGTIKQRYPEATLAFGLEKFTTSEKCFDFVMNMECRYLMRYDTTVRNIAVATDTTEILEYLVKSSAPATRYRHHRDKLKEEVDELKAKLNK